MTFSTLSQEALQDIAEISTYLEQNSTQAAVRSIDRVMQKCQMLAKFPGLGRRWDNLNPPLRSFPVDDRLIFYRPLEGELKLCGW